MCSATTFRRTVRAMRTAGSGTGRGGLPAFGGDVVIVREELRHGLSGELEVARVGECGKDGGVGRAEERDEGSNADAAGVILLSQSWMCRGREERTDLPGLSIRAIVEGA